MKSQLAKIRGFVRFQGSALALPGCIVTLAALAAGSTATAMSRGVHHSLADGHWRTSAEIGLSPS